MQSLQMHQHKVPSRGHVIPHAFRARLRSEPDTGNTKTEKIYVGKGRYVDDSPEKYPDKTTLAGGWAGGEKGLQQFVAKAALETATKDEPKQNDGPSAAVPTGPDAIYLGKGKFVKDDPRKYPNKENAGLLTGATGGFAGGELGVKQFVEKSSLDLAPPEVARSRLLAKDIAAVSVLIAVVVASNYGFRLLEGGPDAAPLPSLDDLASAPAVVTSSAKDLAEGGAAAAMAAVADPRVMYVAALVTAGLLGVTGGRAVRAGVNRATAAAAKGAGRGVVRGAVIVLFAVAALKLTQDW